VSARSAGGRAGYAFVAPALLLLLALNVFPLVYGVVLSFGDADLAGGDWGWIGGANYSEVFGGPEFAAALRTTGLFVLLAVGVELLLGFLLALALVRDGRGKTVVTTLLLVPMMLSPAVMGLYWNLILNGDFGILNQALAGLGWAQPRWLTADEMKLVSILLVDVWMWTPFMMLIALAGLKSIPPSLYEAAAIDRAGRWTVFRRITLPLCAPLLVLAVLFRATDALKQFDLVMAMTGPTDGTTQTVSALLYEVVFRSRKVGLGSAYACVVLVVVIALAVVVLRWLDRIKSGTEEAA
jgi:multiple sugar transport system permease protein